MSILLLILGIVLFVCLVLVHEWGHFVVARRNGVEVEEYGLGFPPKVWSKKVQTAKSKFLLSVNALPLGGFVRLKGEHSSAEGPGTFGAASLWAKTKILMAGVVMNLLAAIALFTLLALIGMPKLIDNQFTVASDTKVVSEPSVVAEEVVPGEPAAEAGIQEGDRLLSVAGEQITTAREVGELTEEHAGQTVPVTISRDDQKQTLQVALNSENEDGNGYMGIGPSQEGIPLQRSTWSAPVVAVGLTGQLTQLTFQGLGTALGSLFQGDTKTASEQVAGPVGVAAILKQGSETGLSLVLFIIAIISLSLAIINALPIPALDGGRLFVLLLFRLIRQPLTKEREEHIHGTGFAALILLIVLITYVDINRFL